MTRSHGQGDSSQAGRLGLLLVSSPHLSLGLGTDREACWARSGDTGLSVPGRRALSLVPWGIAVPSTCPSPDSGMKALTIDGCQSLVRLSLPTRTAWTMPTCSLSSGTQHTLGEVAISQTLPHPPGRGDFCFSHQAIVYVPHPEGTLATNSSKQGQPFAVPSASGSMGSAHCPQNGGKRGTGWAFLVPGKGRKVRIAEL